MSNNNQLIREAGTLIQQFSEEREAERLREACLKLESVNIYKESSAVTRNNLRTAVSGLWLKMINQIDEYLSPDFDPEKTISMQPPVFRTRTGKTIPPGSDPATIPDAADRAGYQKSLSDHKKAQQRYRLQVHLSRINGQVMDGFRNYAFLAYPSKDPDQRELRTLIETSAKNEARKKELLKLTGH